MSQQSILRRLLAVLSAVATVAAIVVGALSAPVSARGATQIGGTISGSDCTELEADYAFRIDGDLNGCVYGTITEARSHPSGTYQEVADEIFIGSYLGQHGTFEMTEFYTHKELVPGHPEQGLAFARCKHPIVDGSGTGVFDGVSGRLDFKDDTSAGTSAYRGHLRF